MGCVIVEAVTHTHTHTHTQVSCNEIKMIKHMRHVRYVVLLM